MMKVLVGPNIMGLDRAIPDLQQEFRGVEFAYCGDRGMLASAIADADIYMGWLGRDEFLAARRLKWVQSPSTGVNYFLAIPELVAGDVLLTGARGTHNRCLSESVFGMILAFTRGVRDSILRQGEHIWAQREIRPKLVELTGSTMGLVGFGASGRAMAETAHAFGMSVLAVDLFPKDKPDYVVALWGLDRLGDLLRESDYVVVTVPWTPQVRDMIAAPQLALMKPSAMLIGISRGGIINQPALADALRSRRLAAAALDVFDPEPLPADSELWDIESLLIMPHVAGGTQYEADHVIEIFRENLGRFLRGDLPLRNQVNKQLGF
jgi:D-2-hydroxyacid dehydrogenase (NADP+)